MRFCHLRATRGASIKDVRTNGEAGRNQANSNKVDKEDANVRIHCSLKPLFLMHFVRICLIISIIIEQTSEAVVIVPTNIVLSVLQ